MRKLLLPAAILSASAASEAAIVTVTGAFTATDWIVHYGAPNAPIDPLYLSYEVTFDDAMDYEADPGIITVIATNIPYPFTFSYAVSFKTFILATEGVPGGCWHGAASFCTFVSDFATGLPYFVEQSPPSDGGWRALSIVTGLPPIVPEPATWAMLVSGLGMAGATMRRRRLPAA